MIGRRVENMSGIIVLGFILCWVGTAGGIYVGVTIYPWAYPLPSGIYALSVPNYYRNTRSVFYVENNSRKTIKGIIS